MPFDLARLETTGLVGHIDFHEWLGSTNDRALELAAQAVGTAPILVLAERQSAGRGRGNNRWLAESGGLTFSLLLHAPPQRLPPSVWPLAALVTGLAVCEALADLSPSADVQVKWPNDVYLGGRKVCGILSESAPGSRDRLVIGIGINVNNPVCGNGFDAAATSLVEHDGMHRDLTAVLIAVLDRFDQRWTEFLSSGLGGMVAEYSQRCFLTGKTVTIQQTPERAITGRCRGITDAGYLRVQTESGEVALASGSVRKWE